MCMKLFFKKMKSWKMIVPFWKMQTTMKVWATPFSYNLRELSSFNHISFLQYFHLGCRAPSKRVEECGLFYLIFWLGCEALGLEWISNHQCTNWPFCPLDGLHFFIQHKMGFITVHFFSVLTMVLFLLGFAFNCFFLGPNLTHSYPIHLPTFINIVPTLVPY
jgi:hypothetical protein